MLVADIEHGAREHVVVNLLGWATILEDERDGVFLLRWRRLRWRRLRWSSTALIADGWWWSGRGLLLLHFRLGAGVRIDGLRGGVVVRGGVCVAGIYIAVVAIAAVDAGIRNRNTDAWSIAAAIGNWRPVQGVKV